MDDDISILPDSLDIVGAVSWYDIACVAFWGCEFKVGTAPGLYPPFAGESKERAIANCKDNAGLDEVYVFEEGGVTFNNARAHGTVVEIGPAGLFGFSLVSGDVGFEGLAVDLATEKRGDEAFGAANTGSIEKLVKFIMLENCVGLDIPVCHAFGDDH